MKKILLLLLGAMLTPQVAFGAVLFEQVGETTSYSTNGTEVYHFPVGGTWNTMNDFYTLASNIAYIRVKKVSGTCSLGASGQTEWTVSKSNGGHSGDFSKNGVENVSGFCDFPYRSGNLVATDVVNYIYPDVSSTNVYAGFTTNSYGSTIGPLTSGRSAGGYEFALCDAGGCGNALMPIVDTTTRFDFTIPSATSTPTVATSTSVGAQVYINPADYSEGMYLDMAFFNHGYFSMGAPSAYEIQYGDKHIELPITASSTVLNLATTTVFSLIGNTNAVYRVRKPLGVVDTILDWWGFSTNSNILLEKNFNFTVATSTGFDQTYQQNLDTINSYTQGTSTPIVNCGIVTFNLSDCIVSLFIPNNETLKKDLGTMRDTVLVRAPIGYVTRFVSILTSTSTAPLPIVTITFTPDSPMRAYPTTFDMGDMFTGGANLLNSVTDPNTGKNAHDIFLPLVQLGVAISVLLTIVSDIMKMHNHGGGNKQYT